MENEFNNQKTNKWSKVRVRWGSLVVFVIVAILSLLGGSEDFDASGYVKATMDALMKGEVTEYVNIVRDTTEEEVLDNYRSSFDSLVDFFEPTGLSEAQLDEVRVAYKALYKKTKYTVLEATKIEDGNYMVEVVVEPILFVENFAVKAEKKQEAEENRLLEEINAGAEYSDEEITEVMCQTIPDALNEIVAETTYGDKETITITVYEENGLYTMSEEEILNLENVLLQ
jgi:hypothetical protein